MNAYAISKADQTSLQKQRRLVGWFILWIGESYRQYRRVWAMAALSHSAISIRLSMARAKRPLESLICTERTWINRSRTR